MTNKEALVAEALEMKLGDEVWLKGLKEDNLIGMIEAVKVRDGKIKQQQKVITAGKKDAHVEGTTTVADLIRAGKISYNTAKGQTVNAVKLKEKG